MADELRFEIVWFGQPKATKKAFERHKKRRANATRAEWSYRTFLADQMVSSYDDEPMTRATVRVGVASNRSHRMDTISTTVINALRIAGVVASESYPHVERVELFHLDGAPRVEVEVNGYGQEA